MDQLHWQVARARRRLILEQFLGRLVLCLLGSMTLVAVAIAAPRIFVFPDLAENWDGICLAAGLSAAFLVAGLWTVASKNSPLEAAIEIDRRYDLRERVASSLSLSPVDQSTDAGRAVLSDALRAIQRIEVEEKFPLRVGHRAWWPLVPAAIVFLLVAFVDHREAASRIEQAATAKTEQQTRNALESIRKKIESQQKRAQEKDLRAADDLFKQIEKATRELSQKEKLDPRKAHVALNDLAKQLEERRKKLGGEEALKEQLQKMKDLGAGPADKAAQALKQGDFEKARQEIEKLIKQLRDGKLDKAAQQQLAKQLDQMKEKLQAAADAHQRAVNDLKKQIEQQKRQGDLAKAGELQQKLEQIQKKQSQMNRLQQLAQQMSQAKQGLQKGDGKQAADSMAQLAQQLDQMQKENDELKMLDATMDQFEMTKDAMACKQCNGEGCEACQGNMLGKDDKNGKPGRGMGQGTGIGPRPEVKNATNTRDTQVKQNARRGPATFEGLVEGPNIKGDVAQTIKQEMARRDAEPADPLTNDRLSISQREQAQEYFETLRKEN
jgi:hypothetical protein